MSDVPDLSSDEENFEEDDWQEMETSESTITCLFCSNIFKDFETSLKHCKEEHAFDLGTLKLKFNMDCYSYIKLINYIKTHKPAAEVIMNAPTAVWSDDRYLKPVDEDDWLMYDFDSLPDKPNSSVSYHVNVENGLVTMSRAHFDELQRTIHELKGDLKVAQSQADSYSEDLSKMQVTMKKFIDGGQENKSNGDFENGVAKCVRQVALEDDEGYFSSYSHFGIHYDMLSDKVRTESYKNAILNNGETLKDKVVLDVGCGTGILSMFAASAGAKKVYAVDQSDIVYHAMDIVRENDLQKTITILKGRLENLELEEKVDIIISEWMGYFLLFEGMLDSIIHARDKYLKPGGLLFPNRFNISLAANGDVATHNKFINYWTDVYGYKMNCMKSEVIKEASVEIVKNEHILTEACVVKDIDVNRCEIGFMDFSSKFSLPVMKDGMVTSLIGYFDTFFDLPNEVSFSTGPHATPTHWKQTVFYFRNCTQVKAGDVIEGTITCNRQKGDVRSLTVNIDVFGKQHKFVFTQSQL